MVPGPIPGLRVSFVEIHLMKPFLRSFPPSTDTKRAIVIRSMADGISFDVAVSLNCTDLNKRGGGA